MSKFINLEGQTINDYTCIKELGNARVQVQCIKCKSIFEVGKQKFKYSKIKCKNNKCSKSLRVELTKAIGQETDGFIIKEELGKGKIIVQCTECKEIFECYKPSYMNRQLTCRNTKCNKSKGKKRIKISIEEVFRGLRIIEELGGNRVIVKCTKCNEEFECYKGSLKSGDITCQNKQCIYHNEGRRKQRILGNTFKHLEVTNEYIGIEQGYVIATCRCCGESNKYEKKSLKIGAVCKNKECINSVYASRYLRDTNEFIISKAMKTDETNNKKDTLYNFTCKQCGFNEYLTKEQCIKHLQGHKHL